MLGRISSLMPSRGMQDVRSIRLVVQASLEQDLGPQAAKKRGDYLSAAGPSMALRRQRASLGSRHSALRVCQVMQNCREKESAFVNY